MTCPTLHVLYKQCCLCNCWTADSSTDAKHSQRCVQRNSPTCPAGLRHLHVPTAQNCRLLVFTVPLFSRRHLQNTCMPLLRSIRVAHHSLHLNITVEGAGTDQMPGILTMLPQRVKWDDQLVLMSSLISCSCKTLA